MTRDPTGPTPVRWARVLATALAGTACVEATLLLPPARTDERSVVVVVPLPGARSEAEAAVARAGGRVLRQVRYADGVVAELPAHGIDAVRDAEAVQSVTVDRATALP